LIGTQLIKAQIADAPRIAPVAETMIKAMLRNGKERAEKTPAEILCLTIHTQPSPQFICSL
jgi:hypothetical protein